MCRIATYLIGAFGQLEQELATKEGQTHNVVTEQVRLYFQVLSLPPIISMLILLTLPPHKHPIFGELLADLGHKLVYRSDPGTVWVSAVIFHIIDRVWRLFYEHIRCLSVYASIGSHSNLGEAESIPSGRVGWSLHFQHILSVRSML